MSRGATPHDNAKARRIIGALLLLASITVSSVSTTSTASGQSGTITGLVFQDFNSNGSRDTTVAVGVAVDTGVAGIVVRAFDSTGAQVGSTTTTANGTYSLSVTGAATTAVRVEFTVPTGVPALEGLVSSFATTTGASGSTAGSAVQFATIGNTGVNHALNRPGDYCQNNPTLVTCASDNGNGSTTNVGAFTVSSAVNGFADVNANTTRIGTSRQLGSVFGIGTDRSRNSFFGTYVRRHVEYGQAGAVNAIYRINHDSPGTVTTFVTLPGTLPTHNPAAVGSFPAYSGDSDIYDRVGRIGLGDVDVTDDGSVLLAVDMDETAPKLWFVPIEGSGNSVTAGTPQSATIPRPSALNGVTCPGTWHPMGIGTRGSRVLIGGTCGAENTVTTSNPRGPDPTQSTIFVLEYSGAPDGSGTFDTVWSQSLSYERGCLYREGTRIPCDPSTSKAGDPYSADWAAWNEYPNLQAPDGPTGGLVAVNPQAMLSNIEITDSGDLIVSLRDRFQDQTKTGMPAYSLAYENPSYPQPPLAFPQGLGTFAGGELVRVCSTGAGYTFESNGTCTNLRGAEEIEPGTGRREYYYDPYPAFADANGNPLHSETFTGATASMPGYPGVWGTAFDVTGLGRQGLLSWGSCAAGTGTCRGPSTGYGSQNGGYDFGNLNGFNKGVALADLEALCNAAPVQIGDRVWIDTDGDGVQDPGEAPASGVTVRLYDANGTLVSTATTNANGEYLFTSTVTEAANGGANPDSAGGNLRTGEPYTIRFDNPADYAAGGPLEGYGIAPAGSTTPVAGDTENAIDSDATVVNGFPRIDVAALSPGQNTHTFDAGFVPLVGVGNVVWLDTDGDGVQDVGESPLEGVTVELLDANGDPARDAFGNLVPAQTTGADGSYFFDGLSPGDYRVKFTPPAGYAVTRDGQGSSSTGSDADRQTGVTPVFTVSPTASGNTTSDTNPATTAQFSDLTIAAGFVPMVSVGDFVWLDSDGDGVQDAGEAGLAGVTLALTNADSSAVTDVFGNSVTTTVTDSQGAYSFDNLPTGQYTVTVTPPAGYDPTVGGRGSSATDSSTGFATSSPLSTAGDRDATLDFGFVPTPPPATTTTTTTIQPPPTSTTSPATTPSPVEPSGESPVDPPVDPAPMPTTGTDLLTLLMAAVVMLVTGGGVSVARRSQGRLS